MADIPDLEANAAFDKAFTPKSASPAAEAPIQQPMESGPVNVINPNGDLVSIPGDQLEEALSAGYSKATDQHLHDYERAQKYGSLGQQLKTAAEGALDAASFGTAGAATDFLGLTKPKDRQQRKEENPLSRMGGQALGIIGSIAALPEAGAVGIMAKAGEAGAEALGLGAAKAGTAAVETALNAGKAAGMPLDALNASVEAAKAASQVPYSAVEKIGSSAVKGAIENMMFQSGDEVSKMISQDPAQHVETAIANVGLAGLIGGGISGGVSSVSPLWKAAIGDKVGGILKAITDKAGGIDGQIARTEADQAIDHAITTSGMELAPEVRAGLSNDPEIQNMFKALEQTDTNRSGAAIQESVKTFRKDAGDTMARAFGKEAHTIPEKAEIDRYTLGKNVGKTLADEYHAQVDPLAKEFESLKARSKDTPLMPDRVSVEKPNYDNPYMPSSGQTITEPGTLSSLADQIVSKAQAEAWDKIPDSDIMREVNKLLKVLPEQKTLGDLGKLSEAVGAQMQKDRLGNGPLFRAGGIIKGIIRDVESDLIGQKLGSEAPELLGRFKAVRQAYGQQAALKEALDSRLHAGGSTASFAKSLREMAQTDGESVLRRLSGVGDADILATLKQSFPKTAELIKDYHLNNVLGAAKDGDTIKGEKLIKALYSNAISPQIRDMIASPEALAKVNAVGALLEQFNKMPHNFSNTGRTIDKMFQYLPGSATAMATMLMGHNPLTAAIVGGLTKTLGKDIPDAVRLSLLKFLGSNKPIEASAFKSMVESIHNTIKGESLVLKATKNVFAAGKKVLPEGYTASDASLDKLDKSLRKLQVNNAPLTEVAQGMSHYMPESGGAAGQVASRAVDYLNNLRPNTSPKAPLDSKVQPNDMQKAEFKRALMIAQSPLTVMEKIQNGSITPKDVAHLQNLYPNLYSKLVQKLTDNVIEVSNKGQMIPYKTRIGLSMFMAQPLDSSMQPMAIVAAQPKPQQAPDQQQPQKPPSKSPTNGLNKMAQSYSTPAQAREKERSEGK